MKHDFHSILITGASSGIGKAVALELAAQDVVLHLIGRNEERLLETCSACTEKGATVYHKAIDVTDKAGLKEIISQWDEENPMDLVLANAGIGGNGLPKHNLAKRFEFLTEVNILGVTNTLEPIIEAMQERKHGSIGLLASMASFMPLPSAPAYSATKSILLVWGDAIGPILKQDNIFVSVICPGFVRSAITDTNNFPMPFFMESDKAAQTIIRGLQKKKPRIAFPFPMYAIMSILGVLPRFIQRFIAARMPNKE